MKTIIINGGNIEDDFALPFLQKEQYDYLIAVDKGLEFCYRAGIQPDEMLGDFDSASPAVRDYFERLEIPVQLYKPEKDQTDMENAMRLALKRGSSEIIVLGATGTRMDHVLGSIYNLSIALDAGVPCALVDAHNRIRMIRHGLKIRKEEQYGKYVSLLAFGGSADKITLTGFYYPLHGYTMQAGDGLGISNEITEEVAEICLESGTLIVVESRD